MMWEVTAGVVLGGVILYILYSFREEIANILVWPFWGIMAIAVLWLAGSVALGAWRIGERVFGHVTSKPTIPEGLFAWTVVIGLVYWGLKR
jgi:hypothetical protein